MSSECSRWLVLCVEGIHGADCPMSPLMKPSGSGLFALACYCYLSPKKECSFSIGIYLIQIPQDVTLQWYLQNTALTRRVAK